MTRFPRLALAACCCALSAGAIAADAPLPPAAIATAERLRDDAVAGSGAYALLESLTTEVGERLAGTPPAEHAVEWAKAKFRALGYDKVYTEPVTFPVWLRGVEDARITSPRPQQLAITTLGGSVGTGGAIEAEVVEFATFDALKAAKPGSLEGKFAYVSNRMERFKDGHGYGPVSAVRRDGASQAALRGARAFLLRSVGTDSDRLPHTGVMHYEDGVAQIPAAALSNPDADLLSNLLRRGHVRIRLDLGAGTRGFATSSNVIGEITGRGKPDQVVVIGGHLDSWDLGTGAIDDGAGVAITMAAGAAIGKLPVPPARTIRVVAWMNEEAGLYGGKAYAAAHAAQLAQHQIGAESDFGAGRVYALHAGVKPAAWPLVEQIGRVLAPLGIVTEQGPGDAGPDIGPLAEKGLAWAQLAQDGTHYFDWHHTANDTLDKVDAKDLDQQVAAYAVLAYLAAQAEGSMGTGEMPLPPPEK